MSQGNYARVNGLDLYYELHGAGDPLVLLHGGGSTIGTTFGRVLPDFAAQFHVIAVELQAHGHTSDRDQPSSFEQDADDVAALLRHLRLPKAHILGFSNGGTTALQLAIRHPQLVDRLVLAAALHKRDGAYPWLWEAMAQPSFDQMPQLFKDAYLEINPDHDALHRMFGRDAVRMQQFRDIPDELIRSVGSATLVLAGDADVVRPEHAVETWRLLPDARLMILPGGHGACIGALESLVPGEPLPQSYPAVALIADFLRDA